MGEGFRGPGVLLLDRRPPLGVARASWNATSVTDGVAFESPDRRPVVGVGAAMAT
jgi:hypothetical protein